MKLSEMTTAQASDVLILIAPEIYPILLDEGLMKKMRARANSEQAAELGLQKVLYLIPALLGEYRENIFRILGAMNGKTTDEISAQSIAETVRQLRELVLDKELIGFFS